MRSKPWFFIFCSCSLSDFEKRSAFLEKYSIIPASIFGKATQAAVTMIKGSFRFRFQQLFRRVRPFSF